MPPTDPRPRLRGTARGAVLGALAGAAAGLLELPGLAGLSDTQLVLPGALAGALLGALRGERLLWLAGGALALLAIVVVNTPLVRPLAHSRVRRDAPGPDVDAVLVLSSGLSGGGRIAEQGPERLLSGLQLARALGRPLVVSVVRLDHQSHVSSLADQRALAALAGLDSAMVTVDSVYSTRDEAVRVAALAARRGWRRLAVVTSPLHSRRACATVERVGLAVWCAPAEPRDLTIDGPLALRGRDERARAFGLWVYEVVAAVVYRARGWT